MRPECEDRAGKKTMSGGFCVCSALCWNRWRFTGKSAWRYLKEREGGCRSFSTDEVKNCEDFLAAAGCGKSETQVEKKKKGGNPNPPTCEGVLRNATASPHTTGTWGGLHLHHGVSVSLSLSLFFQQLFKGVTSVCRCRSAAARWTLKVKVKLSCNATRSKPVLDVNNRDLYIYVGNTRAERKTIHTQQPLKCYFPLTSENILRRSCEASEKSVFMRVRARAGPRPTVR